MQIPRLHIYHSLLTQKITALFVRSVIACIASLGLIGCQQNSTNTVEQWPVISECDLHTQQCTTVHKNQSVSLKINPHPIPIARPLGIDVTLKNLDAEKIELDISGVDMYMGYNRVRLSPATEPGRFIGTSMLAFCTNEKMQWQITLIIHQKEGKQIQIPYFLETRNR